MSRSSESRTSSKTGKSSSSTKSTSGSHSTAIHYHGVQGAVISEIIPGKLFMSNLEGTSDLQYLKALGITHIVSVLKSKQTDVLPPKMSRYWVPIVDIATSTIEFESRWPDILAYLREAIDSGGCALIHCRAGMSRSSTIALAHMMDYHHMTLRKAFDLLQSKHPIAAPITPFFKGLIEMERRLYQKRNPDGTLQPWKPSMTLLDYQLRMIAIIFPNVPPAEFQETVRRCDGNWLTAARVYHSQHPDSLYSFAMRYGVGATPYHPLCDLIAEVRPDEAPSESSSGGRAERERPTAPVRQTQPTLPGSLSTQPALPSGAGAGADVGAAAPSPATTQDASSASASAPPAKQASPIAPRK